ARLEISGTIDTNKMHKALAKILPGDAEILVVPKQRKNIVIMVTKEHHCLSDLLVRAYFGELHANVQAVIGNYETLRPFAEKFGLPFHCVSHVDGDSEKFEQLILNVLDMYAPDYIILAK